MMSEKLFFHIELEHLQEQGEDLIFPFHLHIFNPVSKSYTLYLHANSPMTKEKKEFLEYIISKGGEAAVSMGQKLTFLNHNELEEEDIPDLKEHAPHPLVLKREQLLKEIEIKENGPNGKFHFNKSLKEASESDNFMPLIEVCRLEVMALSVTVSHTTSLAAYLAETLLTEDNFVNRSVALSYHMAKICDMKDPSAIGDLFCAAYFSHLGQTQMSFHYSHMPQIEHSDKQKKEWHKHPGLSQHLIRKSGVLLSERCHKIITEHHERWNGDGYPTRKTGEFLEPLSLILGASSHILEYSHGKVTGDKVALRSIINNMKNKTLSPGLEISFGETIYQGLIHFFSENSDKDEVDMPQAA